MNRIRSTFHRLASSAQRRPVAVVGTVVAAIVAGGLLGAVLAARPAPRDLAGSVIPSSTPGSSIGTDGFGGDVASPTPSPDPSTSLGPSPTPHATPSATPVPPRTQTATPPPEDGYGGLTPSPTAVALNWSEIPDVPIPDGMTILGRYMFELPTGEIAMSGAFDDFSGLPVYFLSVYDPEAREWREVTVEGLDEDRNYIAPSAIGSDGRIFLFSRDISYGWVSITPVDTSSEPWIAGPEQMIIESGFPDPGSMKVAQIGDRLYIPEFDVSRRDNTTTFLVYDLETGEISRTTPIAGARFLNLVSDGTYLYAANYDDPDVGAARYDPTTDSWDSVVPKPPFGAPAYNLATATSVGRLWVPVWDDIGAVHLWTWDGSSEAWSQVETPEAFELSEVRLRGTRAGELYLAADRQSGIVVATDLPD